MTTLYGSPEQPEVYDLPNQMWSRSAREMLAIPKSNRNWSDITYSMVFILFELAWSPPMHHHEAGQFWWWWESPEYLSGQDFIVSSKRWGISVQAPNWKATVAFNMIGPCCESYHKLNFCFLLHWWSLDKGWACYLGVQAWWEIIWRCWSCWGCNMEIPVLLGISLETGPS